MFLFTFIPFTQLKDTISFTYVCWHDLIQMMVKSVNPDLNLCCSTRSHPGAQSTLSATLGSSTREGISGNKEQPNEIH